MLWNTFWASLVCSELKLSLIVSFELWSLFIGTARIVCVAGFMKRYSVRPSVCPTMGPPWQEILIDCCSNGG